jgi:DNA-binding MarR family transcriptional regulator
VGMGEGVRGEAPADALRLSAGDDSPEPSRQDPLDRGILDALTDLVKQAGAISHSIAASLGVAPSDLLALFKLSDGVVSMKELAQRMSCDASFVTVIADTLEREGLAKREPSQRDRRVKELVLTPKGIAAQERLMHELATRMPWCNELDESERQCFLRLLNKMLGRQSGDAGHMRESGSAQRASTVRSE